MRSVVLALATVSILSGSIGSIASAASSKLVQQILPTDCILTLVSNSDGQRVVGECPTDTPVVIEVATNSTGMRVVRGVFDQSRTSLLRVVFNGVVYTAGVTGSPLSCVGDSWEFNIDKAVPNLDSGPYVFTVLATNLDGEVLSATVTVDIPVVEIPGSDGGPNTDGFAAPGVNLGASWGLISLPSELHLVQRTPSLNPGNGVRVWVDDGANNTPEVSQLPWWLLVIAALGVVGYVFIRIRRNRGNSA